MRCHSCLTEISSQFYCLKCRKSLFDGRKVSALAFDKQEFYKKRKEYLRNISISGVQDKMSLAFNEEGILEVTAKNGRYILKPIPSGEQIDLAHDVCANEHLSMQLSQQVFKIPTAKNALIPFSNGELAYITKRFDYAGNGDKLDQEDFASILEYTSESKGKNYKYESSYEACAEARQKFVPAALPAVEDFYKRIVVNYLIGNADAHLKNFSLYRAEGRIDRILTPNYDLLYTRYHVPNEVGYMGLDLSKDELTKSTEAFSAMGYYSLEDFELLAEKLSIKEKRLEKIFELILSSTPRVMEMIDNSFLSQEGKVAYKKNYLDRLRLHLCYSVEQYAFSGTMQRVIDMRINAKYIKVPFLSLF